MASENHMHDICRFDRVHGRFDAYVRELEQLATESFDFLQLLEAETLDPLAVSHIRQQLKRRLEAIKKASEVTP